MLFEKKKKPITNAAELKDFKLFKDKPVPKKKVAADIDPNDIVDVDVIMKKNVVPDAIPDTAPEVPNSEDEKENDPSNSPAPEDAPASPFAKKSSKPAIKLGAKTPEKVKDADKVKKPLFSFGKKETGTPTDKKSAPLNQNKTAGIKPYNMLTFILALGIAGAVGGSVMLKNKSEALLMQTNSTQVAITTLGAEIESSLPKVASNLDSQKNVDAVKLMTRAQLLALPSSELSFEADINDSEFYLSYYVKDSVDQYDFTKFNEAEFPSFATGQFSTCKTNNELTKQGEKDVFAIRIKC